MLGVVFSILSAAAFALNNATVLSIALLLTWLA